MLTVDVGNTSVGVGCWSGDGLSVRRFSDPAEAGRAIDAAAVGIAVSEARWERLVDALPPGVSLTRLSDCPLPVVDQRLLAGAGADRLAAALAVLPGPAIVVDAGTALTVDLVADGVFLGGFIAAGPAAILAGLHQLGDALPALSARAVSLDPAVETVGAMTAGAWGQALGAADRLVGAARARLPGAPVTCTGGWGREWAASTAVGGVTVDDQLVHRGLRLWADGR